MNDQQKLEQFSNRMQHMVIAVTLNDDTPWSTPVSIKRREGSVFEWDSHPETVHSKALATHPQIAMTMFEKTNDGQFGLYCKANAEVVEPKEHGLMRYRLTVTQAWINDETFKKREVLLDA